MNYFKSAVAFFFLFFLHGTSIGTRQQGISYNTEIEAVKAYNEAAIKYHGEFANLNKFE